MADEDWPNLTHQMRAKLHALCQASGTNMGDKWLSEAAVETITRLSETIRQGNETVARLDNERREAHVFLTGKFETGWCMSHPDSQPDTELGKAAAALLADKRRLEAEVARLRRGDWTPAEVQDICHNLHGKVGAPEFAAGCAAEQRKLYGCAPDADEVARLRALLREGRGHHGAAGMFCVRGTLEDGTPCPTCAWVRRVDAELAPE